MGVEITQNHPDHFGLWKMNVNKILHSVGKISPSALLGHFHRPPARG